MFYSHDNGTILVYRIPSHGALKLSIVGEAVKTREEYFSRQV